MDELIRRSDAIKAIEALAIHTDERYLNDLEYGHNEGLAHAIDRIEDIPSADRWIPCSESLPEEQGQYLVTFPVYNGESCVYVLSFCKGKFYETDDEYGDAEYDDVIAWMPLPEPWKGADDELR